MNLILPEPPTESVNALRSSLASLASRGQFSSRKLMRARPDELTATAPLQTFTLSVDQLRSNPSMEAAKPSGWRYLVEVQEQVVAAAETLDETSDGRHVFSHVNDGPFVAGITRAFSAAEQLAENGDVKMRLLHIPALYFQALWGQGDDASSSADDVLIPIEPAPPGIEANRSYNANELLAQLSERASEIPELSADDDRGA